VGRLLYGFEAISEVERWARLGEVLGAGSTHLARGQQLSAIVFWTLGSLAPPNVSQAVPESASDPLIIPL
jgi:hypothetical protein